MITERQKANRAGGIGASEAAVILLGGTPWMTPRGLWALKTGRMEGQADNESTTAGNRWEDAAALEVEDATDRRVVKPTATYKADNGIIFANPDRHFDAARRGADLIEIKNTVATDGWGAEGTDQAPDLYLIQVQTQMLCAGSQNACIARLHHGGGWPKLMLYWIKSDAALMRMIEDRVCGWWEAHVVKDTPPEGAAAPDEIKRWIRRSGKAVTVDDLLAAELIAAHAAHKAAEKAFDDAWAAFEREMGDAEIACNSRGEIVLTYKACKGRTSVDAAKLKAEHPGVYLEVLREGRPFRRRHFAKESASE